MLMKATLMDFSKRQQKENYNFG